MARPLFGTNLHISWYDVIRLRYLKLCEMHVYSGYSIFDPDFVTRTRFFCANTLTYEIKDERNERQNLIPCRVF